MEKISRDTWTVLGITYIGVANVCNGQCTGVGHSVKSNTHLLEILHH